MHSKHLATLLALGLLSRVALANPDAHPYTQINNGHYLLDDIGPWKEGEFTLPPYPTQPDWLGFYVPLQPDFKYFIDAKGLRVDQDQVVRFTLRALSRTGADNISYEGLQCNTRQVRAYAFGDPSSQKWYPSTRVLWKKLTRDDPVRVRLAETLCTDNWQTPSDAQQALMLIKKAPWR